MSGEMLAPAASLALVLAMLGALLWWVRRVARPASGGGKRLQVVETVALGRDQFLHLVRVNDRGLVIASTSRRCELLCELDTPPAEEAAPAVSWVDLLRARLKGT